LLSKRIAAADADGRVLEAETKLKQAADRLRRIADDMDRSQGAT